MVRDPLSSPPPARKGFAWPVGLALQALLIVAAGTLAFAPPARGVMVLAPVLPQDAGAPLRIAVAAGARVLGAGPVRGSLYVEGDRASLLAGALSHGMLLLAGSYKGCSGTNVA